MYDLKTGLNLPPLLFPEVRLKPKKKNLLHFEYSAESSAGRIFGWPPSRTLD